MREKPVLGFWQVWNMCFGFLGIQFGFALQNANVSRIFQSLGASIDDLPILWLAAPVTGLLVQPIVGYLSDRTWGRLGRRRPYFLYGALVATAALVVMPDSPYLWVAAGMLWILDASINVSMEPFRALVGDMLPDRQRAFGFALQSLFIGVGAVVASALPWMLANWFEVSNVAGEGEVPDSVRWSFYLGAAVFLLAVGWTVLRTREYSPAQMREFEATIERPAAPPAPGEGGRYHRLGWVWLLSGLGFAVLVQQMDWDKQLYVLAGGAAAFGLLLLRADALRARQAEAGMLTSIIDDLFAMPRVMRQLAVVQFLSWFALFSMWIYTTPAVTSHHFGTQDASSAAYNEGANWVGLLFGAYNGFAALAALAIPLLARTVGRRGAHLTCLVLGGIGLASFRFVQDPDLLMVSMVGVGFAWASILSMPYAMLAGALPPAKMGVYMGIFNFFIVIPQILAASVLGLVLRVLFGNEPINALAVGCVLMVLAGLATMAVDDREG
ncbi:MAG: MFS transporter [Steroidobacteraceae bacterium]